MRLNRSSNPAMSARIFEKVSASDFQNEAMTVSGTINKIGILTLLVIAGAAYTWGMVTGDNPAGAQMSAHKYMEWYGAFGLLVTLVWLYIEFLRLLSRFAGRD